MTRFHLDLSHPCVMGIVNLTPDSFSGDGQNGETSQALRHAERLLREGAGILDVVMQAVLDLGVDIVNDIWALRQPGAESVVAAHPRCGVCLMHMHRDPQTMQTDTMTGDLLPTVLDFLSQRLRALAAQGVAADRLVLDPGIGFGKTVAQNFRLLARQAELLQMARPVLAGWSRKSSLGAVLAQQGGVPPPLERQAASVAAALLAVQQGASIVRVHDVKPTVDALRVWAAVQADGRVP
jgi:dihydropteroate synthase